MGTRPCMRWLHGVKQHTQHAPCWECASEETLHRSLSLSLDCCCCRVLSGWHWLVYVRVCMCVCVCVCGVGSGLSAQVASTQSDVCGVRTHGPGEVYGVQVSTPDELPTADSTQ